MTTNLSRRSAVCALPALSVTGILFGRESVAAQSLNQEPTTDPKPWPGFPRADAALAREVVGAAHRDEQKVRDLVGKHPSLVNAWWDWGFGDWESPLGAASHVGRRSIAEFLIEQGARMDIFAAAMLGHTDVLRAMVAASPGVQRAMGPHGIPLLRHAKAGGDQAAEALKYLESLGDAGTMPTLAQLTDEQRARLVGRYVGEEGEFEVKADKGQLSIVKHGEGGRNLHALGETEFFPAGVPSVRIRFELGTGCASSLTIVFDRPVATITRRNS